MQMLTGLKTAASVQELRTRLLYTIGLILVFRLGAHVPVPGVDPEVFRKLLTGALFGFLDVISGGAFKKVSVFAMGIMPYINSSIMMQLLTVVIPYLEKLSKEGEEGRKKIIQYTRYGTVILAFIQALVMSIVMRNALLHPGVFSFLMVAISLTAGTVFLMWSSSS